MKFYPYWWEDYKPYHFQNCSINNQTYDLVIIGAGYTGVCAAQESVSKNLKTLLIDQNALGEGASTRSAGMVSGGLNLGKKVDLFKEYGDQMAVDFIKESIDSYRFLEDRVNGYHTEVKFQKTGRLVLAHSKKKLEALRKKTDLLNKLTNLKLDFLKNIDHEISNDYYKGGMLVHDAASIHPSLFYKFLLDEALNCKLDIFSPCKLLSHKKKENYYIVNTTEGVVKTKYLMFATNGYSEKEIGKENYNIIGVPSYIAVTNDIVDRYKTGIYGNTMTGNPKALEIGIETLKRVTPELSENIRDKGAKFINMLNNVKKHYPFIATHVTGQGLLCALHIKEHYPVVADVNGLEYLCRKNGLNVIHGGKNALRFTPNFNITDDEIELVEKYYFIH